MTYTYLNYLFSNPVTKRVDIRKYKTPDATICVSQYGISVSVRKIVVVNLCSYIIVKYGSWQKI